MPHQVHLEVNARLKKRAQRQRRERFLVQQALQRLRIRYWEAVMTWNPLYTGLRTPVDGGWQWLDFVIRTPWGKPAVIVFNHTYPTGRPHLFEKRSLKQKQAFLEQRGLPCLVLPRSYSLDEYEVYIEVWLRKEKRIHEQSIKPNNLEP